MGLSGKYDFEGIKTQGALGLKALLLSFQATAWLTKLPFIQTILEFTANLMANKGLIIFNVGAIYVKGELDQDRLDKALDDGLKRVQIAGDSLTVEEAKEIDDAVIKAADKALPYGKTPKPNTNKPNS